MRIVIYGLAKTGTTALFSKIRNSLPPTAICLFEPTALRGSIILRGRLIAALRGDLSPHVLAKVLPLGVMTPAVERFDRFDKQILLVRDPRDRLVSRLLYDAYKPEFAASDRALAGFIQRLRAKEANPLSVPLTELIGCFPQRPSERFDLSIWASHYRFAMIERSFEFHDRRPDIQVFRYEDLVANRFAGLEAYLGFPLGGTDAVTPELGRVLRTRGAGAWRNWFTPEDIPQLEPLLQPYLDRYYPNADWRLAEAPSVERRHASDYVLRIANEQRVGLGLPAFALPAETGA
ncbi:hypothetical protein [Sphingosinicella sp. BN140058]|uniref:hypothetical protein n=1 Tax=Sphingosinicella sp. BN140058 TaxID=1892855 RepID=UPI00101391A2|nr:hypothetical protein [Sphingosinicella sp. BN140058]QAY79526.1 hypothetical protein ETR14_25495 [Sphingosinicella sp. BN140058]